MGKTFLIILTLILIFSLIETKKWNPEDLAKEANSWDYLNDPESMIPDKELGPKIYTNYLKMNHVYDKTDVNFFIISDISAQYAYQKRKFAEDLYSFLEKSDKMDASTKKQHHLIIVLVTKIQKVLLFPSSDKLKKLIPDDQALIIETEIKTLVKNKQYAQATYRIFDKLALLWKKFSVRPESRYYGKGGEKWFDSKKASSITDYIYLGGSIAFFGFLIFVCCCKDNSGSGKKNKRE